VQRELEFHLAETLSDVLKVALTPEPALERGREPGAGVESPAKAAESTGQTFWASEP
jgi:hypothetical protein